MLAQLEGHTDAVYAVAVEDNTIVSGSKDKTVRIWDRDSGTLLRTFQA